MKKIPVCLGHVKYTVDIRPYGLKLARSGMAPMGTPPKKRDVVKGLSVASGGRLWDAMTRIDQCHGLPLFVTLTYPKDWPGDWITWKRHLHNFRREVLRLESPALRNDSDERRPGAWIIGGVWRLESQRRGAPHYHVLLWSRTPMTGQDMIWLRAWTAHTWYKIVGSRDPKHLRAGTGIEPTKSWDEVFRRMGYLCKYLGKDSVHPDSQVFKQPVGRHWGIWNKPALHAAPMVHEVEPETYCKLRRVVYQMRKVKARRKKEAKEAKEANSESESGKQAKDSKYKRKECFNQLPAKQLERPGCKVFMKEADSRRLLNCFDPIPF